MKHRALIVITLLSVVIAGASCAGSPLAGQGTKPEAAHSRAVETASAKRPVPPPFQTGDSLLDLPPTMAPEIYQGSVRTAYAIAKEIPQTLAQIPCFCGCNKGGMKHRSLHSCYVDDHASKCGVCMNEAFTAYKLEKEQKLKPEQIREKIIEQYSKQY